MRPMTYNFIEDSSSKVVSHYTEAIRRSLELGGREHYSPANRQWCVHYVYLRMELLVEVYSLLLPLNDVQHFPNKREEYSVTL